MDRKLAERYRSGQIKAAIRVNEEMIRFYWSIGADIENRQMENRYGSHFYEYVSKDLRQTLGLTRGLSPTTIKYTRYFYRLYSQLFKIHQEVIDDSSPENRQQVTDDFEIIFTIPWAHHMCIIDRVKNNAHKGLFFVKKTLENNWGPLPARESDLAQELFKSPYDFSFLPGKEKYQEECGSGSLCSVDN